MLSSLLTAKFYLTLKFFIN